METRKQAPMDHLIDLIGSMQALQQVHGAVLMALAITHPKPTELFEAFSSHMDRLGAALMPEALVQIQTASQTWSGALASLASRDQQR